MAKNPKSVAILDQSITAWKEQKRNSRQLALVTDDHMEKQAALKKVEYLQMLLLEMSFLRRKLKSAA